MMCQSTAWKVNVLTQDSIKALTTKVGIGNETSLPFDWGDFIYNDSHIYTSTYLFVQVKYQDMQTNTYMRTC